MVSINGGSSDERLPPGAGNDHRSGFCWWSLPIPKKDGSGGATIDLTRYRILDTTTSDGGGDDAPPPSSFPVIRDDDDDDDAASAAAPLRQDRRLDPAVPRQLLRDRLCRRGCLPLLAASSALTSQKRRRSVDDATAGHDDGGSNSAPLNLSLEACVFLWSCAKLSMPPAVDAPWCSAASALGPLGAARCAAYRQLSIDGFFLRCGASYGADFLAYRDRTLKHAELLIWTTWKWSADTSPRPSESSPSSQQRRDATLLRRVAASAGKKACVVTVTISACNAAAADGGVEASVTGRRTGTMGHTPAGPGSDGGSGSGGGSDPGGSSPTVTRCTGCLNILGVPVNIWFHRIVDVSHNIL